jgi:hypothetical protein
VRIVVSGGISVVSTRGSIRHADPFGQHDQKHLARRTGIATRHNNSEIAMKTLTAVGLAILMSAGVAACSGDADNDDGLDTAGTSMDTGLGTTGTGTTTGGTYDTTGMGGTGTMGDTTGMGTTGTGTGTMGDTTGMGDTGATGGTGTGTGQ